MASPTAISILLAASVTGIILIENLAFTTLAYLYLSKNLREDLSSAPSLEWKVSVSFLLGFGVRGILYNAGFWFGLPSPHFRIACIFFAAILAFPKIIAWCRSDSKRHLRLFRGFSKTASTAQKFILGLFLLIHLVRTLASWIDHDESAVYGYLAEMMGRGLTFSDLASWRPHFPHYGPKLSETSDALWLLFPSGIHAARFERWIRLVAASIFLIEEISAFRQSLRTSMGQPLEWNRKTLAPFLLVPILFGAPELHYLITSLKVDFTLMVFEICCLTFLWKFVLEEDDDQKRLWSQMSILFVAAALATRQSALYAACLVFCIHIWKFFTGGFSFKPHRRTFLILCLAGLGFSSYLACWAHFGNPLYPFQSQFFPHGSWNVTLESYREHMNLFPHNMSFLKRIYLLLHIALGLELRAIPGLPHSVDQGVALIWLSPAILSIFSAPLIFLPGFFSSLPTALKRSLSFFLFSFLFLFRFWSEGVHYTRVFLGGSFCAILFGWLSIESLLKEQKLGWASSLRRALLFLFEASLVLTLYTHIRGQWIETGGPSYYLKSEHEKLISFVEHYGPHGSLWPKNIVDQIQAAIDVRGRSSAMVCSTLPSLRSAHVFFQGGRFSDDCSLHSTAYNEADLFLTGCTPDTILPSDFVAIVSSLENKICLFGKKEISRNSEHP